MAMVIPATGLIVSIEYDLDDATLWARLYDNSLQGWVVDEAAAKLDKPLIIGSLTTAATTGAPIISPQWVSWLAPSIIVPDLWRGSFAEFLTWLATNNGAHRPLEGRFRLATDLYNGWTAWAQANPDLVHAG